MPKFLEKMESDISIYTFMAAHPKIFFKEEIMQQVFLGKAKPKKPETASVPPKPVHPAGAPFEPPAVSPKKEFSMPSFSWCPWSKSATEAEGFEEPGRDDAGSAECTRTTMSGAGLNTL
jgi:hypothetical protein